MIKIICLGKIKEKYLCELIEDYKKRIQKFHKIEILELKDDENILKEEENLLKYLDKKEYIITLEIEGKEVTSTEFANFLEKTFLTNSNITFIIGSSLGLTPRIKALSNFHLSFSKLTYPHGLFRGILLEQIYRAFKIINHESYHK